MASRIAKYVFNQIVRLLKPPLESAGVLDKLNNAKGDVPRYLGGLFALGDFEALAKLKQPWWSFKAQKKIADFLQGGDKDVFEYGSGNSTAWLAERAKSVRSVEYNSQYFEILKQKLSKFDNVHLIHAPPRQLVDGERSRFISEMPQYKGLDFQDFVEAIKRTGKKYDLIVVDGRSRPLCIEESMKHLKRGGMIFVDDVIAKRPHYSKAINELENVDVEHVNGLRPATLWKVNGTFITHKKETANSLVESGELAPAYTWRQRVKRALDNGIYPDTGILEAHRYRIHRHRNR